MNGFLLCTVVFTAATVPAGGGHEDVCLIKLSKERFIGD